MSRPRGVRLRGHPSDIAVPSNSTSPPWTSFRQRCPVQQHFASVDILPTTLSRPTALRLRGHPSDIAVPSNSTSPRCPWLDILHPHITHRRDLSSLPELFPPPPARCNLRVLLGGIIYNNAEQELLHNILDYILQNKTSAPDVDPRIVVDVGRSSGYPRRCAVLCCYLPRNVGPVLSHGLSVSVLKGFSPMRVVFAR